MQLRSEILQRWWPATQCLDLVEGTVDVAAAAVHAEVGRFSGGAVETYWQAFPNLDSAFTAAPNFASWPTFFLVLPTNSKWSVLWNNSWGCDGYDSLCWCLTTNHGLTTIHSSANDTWTTFQSGAKFTYRRMNGTTLAERSVYAGQEDKRWLFFQTGDPLPEENVTLYNAKRKRDRLNESELMKLLARLGASPWSEEFYSLSTQSTFVLRLSRPPATTLYRQRSEVLNSNVS